jgi:hypothetical protein
MSDAGPPGHRGAARPSGGEGRPTPFALALPGADWCRERFQAIAEEAGVREINPGDPGSFLLLAQVGAALQDLLPEEDAAPGELHSFGRFLFHAFHLLPPGDGAPPLLLEVGPEAARSLVAASISSPEWNGEAPSGAGYLRLPPQRFWVRPGGPESIPEGLDGVAWTVSSHGAEGPTLHLLALSGIVPGRPGFSVLPLPGVPFRDAASWIGMHARPEGAGADFETTLPGGELGGLHSVETAGEVVKLVALAFAGGGGGGLAEGEGPPPVPDAGFDACFERRTLPPGPEDPKHAP